MAMHVLAARSEQAAARARARLTLPEAAHRALFGDGYFRDLSLINRLADPYRDATYFHEELPILQRELESLATRFPKETPVSEFLQGFHRVCRDALNGGLHLYCHVD